MRRAAVLLVALAALLVAVPVAPAVAPRTLPVKWHLVEAGPRDRSVVIGYAPVNCLARVSTHVHATAAAITIAVVRTVPPPVPVACPNEPVEVTRTVHLPTPIAGRPIRGLRARRPAFLGCPTAGRCALPAPRVVGLDPADARSVLEAVGLTVEVTRGAHRGGHVRVLGQRPRVHAAIGRTRTAHLIRSRTG